MVSRATAALLDVSHRSRRSREEAAGIGNATFRVLKKGL